MTTIYLRLERTPPCMGGWCAIRETCARYNAGTNRPPAERLCAPNQHDAFIAMKYETRMPHLEAA